MATRDSKPVACVKVGYLEPQPKNATSVSLIRGVSGRKRSHHSCVISNFRNFAQGIYVAQSPS